jgi:hypothetical protein
MDDLEGDAALERRIERAIDLAHAAGPRSASTM